MFESRPLHGAALYGFLPAREDGAGRSLPFREGVAQSAEREDARRHGRTIAPNNGPIGSAGDRLVRNEEAPVRIRLGPPNFIPGTDRRAPAREIGPGLNNNNRVTDCAEVPDQGRHVPWRRHCLASSVWRVRLSSGPPEFIMGALSRSGTKCSTACKAANLRGCGFESHRTHQTLGRRLMVGREILELAELVRSQPPQPENFMRR